MKTPLRVLLIEDSADDAQLVVDELRRSGYEPLVERVETAAALQAALQRQAWDVVISDYRMPDFSGPAALKLVKASGLDLPFIIVSGTIGEEQAVTAIKLGAHDYLLKDRLGRLGTAVAHELENTRLRQASRQAEQQLLLHTTALETAANAVTITDAKGIILWVNPAFTALSGYAPEAVIGHTPRVLKSGKHDQAFYRELWRTILSGQTWRGEFINRRKDGSLYHGEQTITPVRAQGGAISHFIGIMNDVTARTQAEAALRESEERLRIVTDNARVGLVMVNRERCYTFANAAYAEMLGLPSADLVGQRVADVLMPLYEEQIRPRLDRAFAGERVAYELHQSALGAEGHFAVRYEPTKVDGEVALVVVVITDITERKQAEAALRRSEADLQLALDAAQMGRWDWNIVTGEVTWSRQCLALYGLPPDTVMIYEQFLAAVHPEDRERARSGLQRAVEEHTGYDLEKRVVWPDGSLHWTASRGRVYYDAVGHPLRMTGVTFDITERKRTEEELRRTGDLLRAVAAGTSDAVFVKDLEGRYLLFNEAASRFVGKPAAAVIGQDDTALFDPEGAKLVMANDRAVRESGQPQTHEERLTAAGVTRIYFTTKAPYRDAQGNIIGTVGISRDITERKQAEEALREAEVKYRGIFENAVEGILRTTPDGRILTANPAFAQMLGYESAEALLAAALSMRRDIYADPQDRANFLQQMAEGDACNDFQCQLKCRNGKAIWVSFNARPMRDASGTIQFYDATCMNITERKQLEAQFLRAQRMESIGSLAGGIAHDLNNALAPILMASELLKLTNQDADKSHVLDTIYESAKRGAGMVKQILTFARGSEGERGVVQPKHLVKEMIDIARHTFPKSIQIRTDVATDTWTLLGNPTQLHQILLNLCVNARDAMPTGGTLTLATGNVRLDAACTMLSPDAKPGPCVLLTVTDTGTGMPPEVQARIFDAFFTTKEPGKGTGLGLSTVLNIAKDHGGFLTVDSAVGWGTTFKVYLPAQETTGATVAEAAPPALPMGKGELILVVDDEAAIRTIATQTLQAYGYRVVTANDGAQAVGICARHLADVRLLITDMAMPIMGGKATICAIRTILPRLPVIAASGSDSLAGAPLQKELDMQAFLRKPFSADDLIRTVHEVLQGQAAE